MKLTPEQTEMIRKYIATRGFNYPEVQMEILDHVATFVEEKMTEDPALSFEDALNRCRNNFGVMGFSSISDAITDGLEKKYSLLFWNQFASAFNFKYIGIIIIIAVGLFHLLNYTGLDANIFYSLVISHFFINFNFGLSKRFVTHRRIYRQYLSYHIAYKYTHLTPIFYSLAAVSLTFLPETSTIYELNTQLVVVTGIITLMVPYYYALWHVMKRGKSDIEDMLEKQVATTT